MNLREPLLLIMAGWAMRVADTLRTIRQDRIVTGPTYGTGLRPTEVWETFLLAASVGPEEVERSLVYDFTTASLGKRNKNQGKGPSKQQHGGEGMLGKSPGWIWAQSAPITQSIIGGALRFMPKVDINPFGIKNTSSTLAGLAQQTEHRPTD